MRPTIPIAILLLALAAPCAARAEPTACDTFAADPTDPDRPKDVPGVADEAIDAGGVVLLRKIAEAGQDAESATATGLVGFAYLAGSGVAKDTTQGFAWLRRAAQAGNPRARAFLADGEGQRQPH